MDRAMDWVSNGFVVAGWYVKEYLDARPELAKQVEATR
jgi:hypothetical protein